MSIFLYIIYSLVKESCRHFDIVPTFDDVDFFDSVDKKENVLIDDRSQWKENKFVWCVRPQLHENNKTTISVLVSLINFIKPKYPK